MMGYFSGTTDTAAEGDCEDDVDRDFTLFFGGYPGDCLRADAVFKDTTARDNFVDLMNDDWSAGGALSLTGAGVTAFTNIWLRYFHIAEEDTISFYLYDAEGCNVADWVVSYKR